MFLICLIFVVPVVRCTTGLRYPLGSWGTVEADNDEVGTCFDIPTAPGLRSPRLPAPVVLFLFNSLLCLKFLRFNAYVGSVLAPKL